MMYDGGLTAHRYLTRSNRDIIFPQIQQQCSNVCWKWMNWLIFFKTMLPFLSIIHHYAHYVQHLFPVCPPPPRLYCLLIQSSRPTTEVMVLI